jgi:cell division septation protein DedD
MKNVFLLVVSFAMMTYFIGCSSQPAENSQEKILPKLAVDTVAAPVAQDTVKSVEKEDTTSLPVGKKFTVQVGAFTTIDKANALAADAGKVFQKQFLVSFNDQVKLYVVRSIPLFDSKIEADSFKAEVQKIKGFEDAWVVTLE